MKRLLFVCLLITLACERRDPNSAPLAFPPQVDSLFRTSCATSGCHLPDEHDLAKLLGPRHLQGDLDLSSWTGLFRGGESGAAVVPFNIARSHMIDHIEGRASPRMPPLDTLPSSTVEILKAWIAAGAPAEDGTIPFADATAKLFATNQVDDEVTVVDQNSGQVMRVFAVGDRTENESPHGMQVSPEGQTFYVSMIVTGDVFQYDAVTGTLLGKTSLHSPTALLLLNADGSKLYVTTNFLVNNPLNENGWISVIRTSDMVAIDSIPVGSNPHGIQLSRDGKYLYVSAANSDRLYVIDTTADTVIQTIDVAADVGPDPKYEPYHIAVGPKNSSGYEDFLFVTCRKNGQLRMFARSASILTTGSISLVDSLSVGSSSESKPIQCEVTPNGQYVFVANSNDSSVTVVRRSGAGFTTETHIRAQVNSQNGVFHRLSQPNGVAISLDGKTAYIANRNKNAAVPPHHGGGGGPGLITVIDVSSLTILQTIEVTPDCYSLISHGPL